MILGSAMIVLIYMAFAFTNIHPSIPQVLLGVAFALVPAAMWPSVAKIIDESKIGTAYGAMFSIQNLGLWAFPLLIGIVLEKTNPGITFAILLKREDKRSGYGLELPSNKKK